MTAKVILNPYAGRWSALQRRQEAESALDQANIAYELVMTDAPGHAIELAKQAAISGFSPIIAAGGDGTISEVVNGMAQAAGTPGAAGMVPLGVLPLGSADDFVDNVNLPRDLFEAARVIASGNLRRLDLCQVTWMVNGEMECRYFDNNSAIGLEPYITIIQERIHRVKGNPRYMLATLMGVLDKPSWNMQIDWEGGSYSGPITLVTVGNNPRTGGVFYVTPHAKPDDGQLTFVYGYLPTRRQILTVLPRLMKPDVGSYVEHPAIHEIHSPWLRVVSDEPTPLHADGEMQARNARQIEFKALPGRLPLLING